MYLWLIPHAFPFSSGLLLNWWDRVERHFSPLSFHNAAEAVVTPHPDKYHNYHLCLSQLSRLLIDCHIHHTCTHRGASASAHAPPWCVRFHREVKGGFSATLWQQNPTVGKSVLKCPRVDQIGLAQPLHSSQLMSFLLRRTGGRREANRWARERKRWGRNRDWRPSQISNRCVQTAAKEEKRRGPQRDITD